MVETHTQLDMFEVCFVDAVLKMCISCKKKKNNNK
jgi:hypothetical protein